MLHLPGLRRGRILVLALVDVLDGLFHDRRPEGPEAAHRDAVREQLVDLLQRTALGLGHAQVEEHEAAEV